MKKVGVVFLFLSVMSGCASMTHRGVIAMKVSDTEAHVGMGKGEVSVGDHVQLYRNVCAKGRSQSETGGSGSCEKRALGHGVVGRVISDDYAVVQFERGVQFSEGDMIEKHAH